jgi:magnesium-transporting ATPase (P-type)
MDGKLIDKAACQFKWQRACLTDPDPAEGVLLYQAQSPDENALVSAARNFGFAFTDRTSRTITIQVLGVTEVHELLCILDFNNVRKRMSVIVRHEGRIRLYCKGADNVILERVAAGQQELVASTQEHLDRFATEGLRTLLLGYKDLSQRQFEEWKTEHHKAALAQDTRDEKLDAVYDLIEKDLVLLGATAIEDKLQDGVSETIANLQLAGIKVCSASALCTLHSALCTLHSALCALHSALCTAGVGADGGQAGDRHQHRLQLQPAAGGADDLHNPGEL